MVPAFENIELYNVMCGKTLSSLLCGPKLSLSDSLIIYPLSCFHSLRPPGFAAGSEQRHPWQRQWHVEEPLLHAYHARGGVSSYPVGADRHLHG